MHWDGQSLVLDLDEWSLLPWPRRLRGRLRLQPQALAEGGPRALSSSGRHHWWPIAPSARMEVALDLPGWQWRGPAYLDSNRGDEPLEQGFRHWQWARASLGGGCSAVVYDAQPRSPGDGASPHETPPATHLALRFDAAGRVEPFSAPPLQSLPGTAWQLTRQQRSDAGEPPRLIRTLEDTPFYHRSLLRCDWLGLPRLAMHEGLDLDRFASRWVQTLLPFRMPRRSG
jgi:carotenoid 1,2-hydratase